MLRLFRINGMPKYRDFNAMPFGRQIDGLRQIAAFQDSAESIHLSQKRQNYRKAIQDAILLNDVDQYFCQFAADKDRYDDTFEFWYTTKQK